MERFGAWVLVAALVGSACGKAGGGSAAARASVEDGFAVGLLLPENKTARYETFDRPLIEKNIRAACPKCTVLYQNAEQDAAKQQTQADSVLSRGIRVLILDAVDSRAAASIALRAAQQHVPVVAYDRFASGPIASFVTFDAERTGEEQARALVAALAKGGDPKRGPIVMINGSPTDPNAAEYKRGAHRVLDGVVDIGFEADTPDWSPDKAQQQMEQALTRLGASKVIGVYVANDGMASGVVAALKGQGVSPLPPVTGQDAELAAIQRIVAGDQHMTIYAPYAREAEIIARMAIAAATGTPYDGATEERVNASGHKVPSVLLSVVPVTRDRIKDTVVADGVYTAAEICAGAFAAGCAELGLQ